MNSLSSSMQENTLYQLIKSKLKRQKLSKYGDNGKPEDDESDQIDEENAAFMSHEMAVLVSAQNMIRMVRKLHVAMLILGLVSLAIMAASLAEKWYGDSKHAGGALQGLTVVFSFALLIMWLIRAESPTNILMLLIVMAFASLSMGIVCGVELAS